MLSCNRVFIQFILSAQSQPEIEFDTGPDKWPYENIAAPVRIFEHCHTRIEAYEMGSFIAVGQIEWPFDKGTGVFHIIIQLKIVHKNAC
jgi:hypothetical protein